MNIFQIVKENVTARQAAEQYGMKVNKNGMVCCPFHNDRHPSMKVDKGFCCFACGAKGDVITFVADFFHLTPLEAVKKLAEDFRITVEKENQKKGRAGKKKELPKRTLCQTEQKFEEWERECIRILSDYLHLLENWKVQYAPKTHKSRIYEFLKSMGYTFIRIRIKCEFILILEVVVKNVETTGKRM